MPECDIVSINDDFDASKFTVVPDLSKDIEIDGDTYIFFAKIIPNEDVSDDFEIVDVELPVTRLPGGPAQG
jgi:hypothetical protein